MIDEALLTKLLDRALQRGGDYADVFCERRRAVTYRLQDGRVHDASYGVTLGIGIRVQSGEAAGFACSDDLSERALLEAAASASLIARDGQAGTIGVAPLKQDSVPDVYRCEPRDTAEASHYVALLERADVTARRYDPHIVAVNAQILDEIQEVWVATSEGRLVHDCRPLITLGVQAVGSDKNERSSGYAGDGGRTTIAFFERQTPEMLAEDAARIAMVNLSAIPAPAGEMEMIVGSGGGGVLLHEAVGHGLESDFNRRGTSLYSGRVGERVANELVTIYDDGNLHEERGSVAIDDEGVPGQHKVLVENGVLRGYMQDTLNARLMGVTSTGSGRRQSFRFPPQPRMCNTYMPNGKSTVDEIVASTKRGIYAKSFAGGQVEIAKGDFVFMVGEGYLVEDGKITAPVRNASIVGNGPDAMMKVVAVGNDCSFARRHYTCGKGGQYVPVGVGMPTVKISSITVGGTQA